MSATLVLAPSRSRVAQRTVSPRVLFVDHSSRLAGAELVLLDVVRGLADARVFLFEDGDLRAALDAAGVASVVSRRAADFARVKRDRSLLRAVPMLASMGGVVGEIAAAARSSDVVYANSQKAFVLAAPAALLARRRLVWHLHDILSDAHFAGSQRRLVVTLANRVASRVIVPSQATADAFVAAGGRPAQLRVVPNGITLPSEPLGRAALRAELGLPDGFLFGVFSRLAPWKGQMVALQALAALPGAVCIMAGDALFGEDAYAAELRRAADTLGIAARVRFLGHRSDVPRLMRAVDVVVHPSIDAEPFGRTVLEAMLCRTPVIATATGAVPDILDGGAAGVLVPAGDVAALATALAATSRERDAASPEAAARIGRAEARAIARYSAQDMRAGIAAVLAELSA